MLLFCCHTPAHEVLYRQVFLPSVPEGFEVCSTILGIDGPGDYLSDEFLRCIRAKLDLVIRSVEENLGDIIVWCDVDIRFFDLSPSALAAELESSACDVLFQRESPRMDDVNTGFFVCRCTTAVLEFFKTVRSELESHPEEKGSSAKSVLIPFLTYRSDCQWLGRLRRVGDRWFRTTNRGNGSHRNGGGERRREPVPGSSVCGGRRLCKPACEIVFRHRHGIASRSAPPLFLLLSKPTDGALARPNKCPLVFQKYRDKIPPQAAPFRIWNSEFGMEKPENEKQISQIPWGYLPRSFYARTHGWPPPRHLAIYHANYTKGRDGVGQKLAQLREVDWMVRGGWPARILSIARRIPGRIFPLGSKDG